MSHYELLALEYDRLKEEQVRRIGFRDNLIYVTITAMAAIFGFAIQDLDRVQLLLAVCPAALVLGWTYLANDLKISAIGAYIRDHLGPQISSAAGLADGQALQWEVSHYGDTDRNRRKIIQLGIDLLTFCVPSFAALVIYGVIADVTGWSNSAGAVEALLTAALAAEMARSAELGSGSEPASL